MKTSAQFLRCGRIIGKMRIVTVTSFLNDDGSLFQFLFWDGRVGYDPKRRRWWSDGHYLSLTITKTQHNGIHNILKESGVTEDIEDRFSFLLVTKKILAKSFKIL